MPHNTAHLSYNSITTYTQKLWNRTTITKEWKLMSTYLVIMSENPSSQIIPGAFDKTSSLKKQIHHIVSTAKKLSAANLK